MDFNSDCTNASLGGILSPYVYPPWFQCSTVKSSTAIIIFTDKIGNNRGEVNNDILYWAFFWVPLGLSNWHIVGTHPLLAELNQIPWESLS